MAPTMRVAPRTRLVLVLCLAGLAGARAQASFFSGFFTPKDPAGDVPIEVEVPEEVPEDALATTHEEHASGAKMRALIAEATRFGMDLGDDLGVDERVEDEAYGAISEDATSERFFSEVAGEIRDAEFVDEVEEETVEETIKPQAVETQVTETEIVDSNPQTVPDVPGDITGDEDAETDAETDEDDASVFARMAAVEARLLELTNFEFPEDDIEDEWVDSFGDGFSGAPFVRAPRTLLTKRDAAAAEELITSEKFGDADTEKTENRRKLLVSSVSGDNTKWVGFQDMPTRLGDSRSGPETRVGRDHGEALVTRAGGYWQAARFNKVERPSRQRRAVNFGKGSGEGTLSGPRGGINQHDRVGVNKASGWPGELNSGKVSTERYPGTQTRDILTALQPFVKKVTSYSPNVRGDFFLYRKKMQMSKLWCVASAGRSCADTSVFSVSIHDVRVGDAVTFQGVLGADRQVLLDTVFTVASVASDQMSFTTNPKIDTSGGALAVDVTSAFIVGSKKSTASNPTPLHAARGFSYENDDDVYFFVHFSEPIVVSGTPTLTMKTGSHFENGAVHGTALFIGGGVGEKSTFWKNENGIYFASRAGGVYTDKYAVHDGGCTLGNAQLDGSLASDCVFYSNDGVSCDCSVYSGITHLADAQVRTRRVHHFVAGDIVEVTGVTGSDSSLLNKRHTIGVVSGTGASGTNLLRFEPPLGLVGKTFDARDAVVAQIARARQCRAAGASRCVYQDAVELLNGDGNEGSVRSVSSGGYGQSMDNILAFVLRVNTSGGVDIENYDQARDASASANQPEQQMLSGKLAYDGPGALSLGARLVTIKRACVDVFQIVTIECGVHTTITVTGKHRLLPGDYVSLQGVGVGDAPGDLSEATKKAWNREHAVFALPANSSLAVSKLDWRNIWDASPYWGSDVSKFQIDFNTSAGVGLCDNAGAGDGGAPPSVSKLTTFARKTRNANVQGSSTNHDSKRKCVFADADTKLPKNGYAGSLEYTSHLTIGRPFVTNVTARTLSGSVFGHNGGSGIRPNERVTATRNLGGPDVLHVVVSFSEDVYGSCGVDDEAWTSIAMSPGIYLTGCESVKLVLRTSPDAAVAGSANFDTTTGTAGTEIFPTSFLAPRDLSRDQKNELVFQYVVRRGDKTEQSGLQYTSEFAMVVGCAVSDGSGGCSSWSKIRRTTDNAPASTRLPPTRRDAGRCIHGPDDSGIERCASATADHRNSLLGSLVVVVDAEF